MRPGFLLRLREDEPLGNGRGKVYLVKCSKIYLVSVLRRLGNGEGGREAELLRDRVIQRAKVAVTVPRGDKRVALLGPAARLQVSK